MDRKLAGYNAEGGVRGGVEGGGESRKEVLMG